MLRVLVVDDNESIAITISELLLRQGYIVHRALSGEEALQTLENDGTFDVLLTDLEMGDVHGLDLLAFLRKHSLPTKAVILTGYPMAESRETAARLGAFEYLVKPCPVDQIISTVGRAAAA